MLQTSYRYLYLYFYAEDLQKKDDRIKSKGKTSNWWTTKLNLKGHFVTDDLQNITFRCEGTSKYWGLVSMYGIKPNLSISELKSNYFTEF